MSSGFNHVEKKITQRLLQVKGKHHVRSEEVEKSWSSFNDGDVFILDLGNIQFVWMGKESSRTERIKVRSDTLRAAWHSVFFPIPFCFRSFIIKRIFPVEIVASID